MYENALKTVEGISQDDLGSNLNVRIRNIPDSLSIASDSRIHVFQSDVFHLREQEKVLMQEARVLAEEEAIVRKDGQLHRERIKRELDLERRMEHDRQITEEAWISEDSTDMRFGYYQSRVAVPGDDVDPLGLAENDSGSFYYTIVIRDQLIESLSSLAERIPSERVDSLLAMF